MDTVCPLCNGMITPRMICRACGAKMEDRGQRENFYEPYSPYENDLLIKAPRNTLDPSKWCWHVFICPFCEVTTINPIEQLKGNHYLG